MFDIEHDSPVPIHEQLTGQIMGHIASGALKAGAELPEYRAFAQKLLANPQVVARAYDDLQWDGVLEKMPSGEMQVTERAELICRVRLQTTARQRIQRAVIEARSYGLPDDQIRALVNELLAAPAVQPLSPEELSTAFKKSSHASSHRDSQGIQVLSGQKSRGSPQPEHPGGSDIRPARG